MESLPDIASDYASRIGANLGAKTNRAMVVSTGVVAILGFAGMVSAAYTADHINKSKCDKNDPSLKSAYKWSWVTAVVAGLTAAGMVGILAKTALTKKA